MPIWIKYGGWLGLCSEFVIVAVIDEDFNPTGSHDFRMFTSPDNERFGYVAVPNLIEQQARDLMRNIVDVVSSGGRYYEIPERSKS